jgi:hypothetical protein
MIMKLASTTLKTFSIALSIILISSDQAFAWGTGIHIMEGSYVLDHLHLIFPRIAEILKAFPHDYLYGCISADIFIGKGSRRRDDHCHNWSNAMKMLAIAESPAHFSFAYGYLCHLCTDIIAHNFYIPNQLYLTTSTKKFGHIYWECRSDAYIEKKYWELANKIISRQNSHNDEFMQGIFKSKIVSFQTKKKIYLQSIKLYDLKQWQNMVSLISRNSRWDVSKYYVLQLHKLSLNLIFDFLNHTDNSICLSYDPVGSDNIRIAKKERYVIKRAHRKRPTEKLFTIPDEIVKLSDKAYGMHF